jgi:hypothetical protein
MAPKITSQNGDETKELGVISGTELGFEHGILTFMLTLDFGGTRQGFGGWCLDDRKWHSQTDKIPGVTGAGAIALILKAVGVQSWEDLKGKQVWAYRNHGSERIVAIEAPAFVSHGDRFDVGKYFEGLTIESNNESAPKPNARFDSLDI